jgi:hypothetical protein
MVWTARTTFFWAVLMACVAVVSAGVGSSWLAYGLSAGGGFFVAMLMGSLTPNCVKREDAWMGAALGSGMLATLAATLVARNFFPQSEAIAAAALVGALAGGIFSIPMSVLLFRLWNQARGYRQMAVLYLHNENFAGQAASYLDNALALEPSDPELYNLRAIAMVEDERAGACRR